MTAIYVGLFVIRPWETLIPELQAIKFERTYAIAVIVCVVATSGLRIRMNLANLAVFALTGGIGWCALFARDGELAWNAYYDVLTVVVCYFVLVSVIRSPYDLFFIIGAYIISMEVYLMKALWEYFINGQHVYDQGVYRLVGIENSFGNHNKLAASIVVSLPIWVFLWESRVHVTAGWPDRWRRGTYCALALYPVLSIVSVILTNSRSGMGNLCVFVLLTSLRGGLSARLVRNLLIALLLIGVGWLALPEEHKNRVRTIWNPEVGPANAEASKQGRIDAFWAAMEIFRRCPLNGVGPGNFGAYRTEHIDGIGLSPHNLLGQMLAETGSLGTGAFVFFLGVVLYTCRRVRAVTVEYSDPTLGTLAQLAVACRNSVFLLCVEGIAGHNFYRFNWLWLMAFVMLAAEFAADCGSPDDHDGSIACVPACSGHTNHAR